MAVVPRVYRAVYDYAASADTDLTFKAGESIAVIDNAGGNHEAWWYV